MGGPAEAPATEISPEQTLRVQVQQFLDEWFYRILASSIGKAWSRKKAATLLMEILEMVGLVIPADQKEAGVANSENDEVLVAAIIAGMPDALRGRWETVALQLQTILHEATRIRTAAEEPTGEAVSALFEEAGSDRGGLTQQVLKASVIFAAKEVSQFRNIHISWRKNTDDRIDRLLNFSEKAEHLQQQLLSLESQLSEMRGDNKAKNKGLLLSMAEGRDKTLVHSIFSSWLGYVEKCHGEKGIRQKFTDLIENIEGKLISYKEAQIANIKGILMRGAMEETEVLMQMVWKFWNDDIKQSKAEGDSASAVKAAQDRLNSFESGQKEKAGQFMTRMAAGNDASLTNLCLEAWIKFHQDYAQDKEMEDKVKNSEAAFKAHMDLKKDEAKAVLDRMLAASGSGLLSLVIQNWASWLKEEKKTKELEYALSAAEDKFKSLNGRQKAGAHSAQNKVNDQINFNLMMRVWNCWLCDFTAERVQKQYKGKYERKKKQMQTIQELFKSFSQQLETSLRDEDESERGDRRSKRHGGSGSKGAGADGAVSLPNIHERPGAC